MKFVLTAICLFLCLGSCSNQAELQSKQQDWAKTLNIYEIMPKNYSTSHNLRGVFQNLRSIRSQFISGIALLPLSPTQDGNNSHNAGDPFASIDFTELDTSVTDEKTLRAFIDSCHLFKLKVFLELNLSYSGPAHQWRKKYPEFYLSSEETKEGKSNPDYVRFNLENEKLKSKLLDVVDHWTKKYDWDGLVILNGEHFTEDFWRELGKTSHDRGKMLIASAAVPKLVEEGIIDSYFNTDLQKAFDKMADGSCSVSDFTPVIEANKAASQKSTSIFFNQNAVYNLTRGPEYKRCSECYKQTALICYMLGGVPWVLNGQEEPMFFGINTFTKEPISNIYQYNRDFYRSLNIHRKEHPALISMADNLPQIQSNSDKVLVFERKSGNASIVFMGNLSPETVRYQVNKDFRFYTEFFTRAMITFETGVSYTLAPYQYLVLTNIK